jgi:integrase
MAQTLNRLNAMVIKGITKPGRYADGGGLYLATTGGGRRWVFLFRWKGGLPGPGKPTEMGLGSASSIPLAKARILAAQAREQVAMGINPLHARRIAEVEEADELCAAEAAKVTFGQCADELIANMSPGWRNPKHAAQWKMTLREYAAPLRPMSVGNVKTSDVLGVLQTMWSATPETASRFRGRIERVLDYAKAKGLRSGENPARWRGHLDQVLPKPAKLTRGHHAALPYDDIPTFMARLRARDATAAKALEFAILTAARSGEVLRAEWREIDMPRGLWTIPASRMKAGREHRVPLSEAALAILRHMEGVRRGKFVFPSQGPRSDDDAPLSSMALEMLIRRMGDPVTPHGFRSTFRDWASETTGFSHEVCEMALAHTISNKAEAAYRRGDVFEKRRALMAAWADYCAALQDDAAEIAA